MSQTDNGFTYKDGVTLREYFDVKFELQERALTLQAEEYRRRLSDLNNEAERLRVMQTTYLPREVYESNHSGVVNKIEALEKIVFVGLGIAITLQFVLHFFK